MSFGFRYIVILLFIIPLYGCFDDNGGGKKKEERSKGTLVVYNYAAKTLNGLILRPKNSESVELYDNIEPNLEYGESHDILFIDDVSNSKKCGIEWEIYPWYEGDTPLLRIGEGEWTEFILIKCSKELVCEAQEDYSLDCFYE